MATTPCSSPTGKHKWEHIKDYLKQTATIGLHGTRIYSCVRGKYECATCAATRSGRASPKGDLRLLMSAGEPRGVSLEDSVKHADAHLMVAVKEQRLWVGSGDSAHE